MTGNVVSALFPIVSTCFCFLPHFSILKRIDMLSQPDRSRLRNFTEESRKGQVFLH